MEHTGGMGQGVSGGMFQRQQRKRGRFKEQSLRNQSLWGGAGVTGRWGRAAQLMGMQEAAMQVTWTGEAWRPQPMVAKSQTRLRS